MDLYVIVNVSLRVISVVAKFRAFININFNNSVFFLVDNN